MSDLRNLPFSLERLPEYIGRDDLKARLHTYATRILTEKRCYMLYIEAEGGMGKTHLLRLFPQFLSESQPTWSHTYTRLRIARIVDFYSFQNRDPNVIERQLIDGLRQSDSAEWYHVPSADVDDAFQEYIVRLEAYQRAHEIGDETRISSGMTALRDAFVTCWNRVAETHPLVMCFDTLETLFFRPAPPEALLHVGSETAGVDLVISWMRSVLPRLHRTLVLLSGRPVENNRLVRELSELGLLAEPVQQIGSFASPAVIRAYLEAYQCPTSDNELPYIQTLTEGRPLLLTCFAETRRSTVAMPPGLPTLPNPSECASRPEFEDWLVGTLLNPMVDGLPTPELHERQMTLSYCLYFLVYARRGIPRQELIALFENLELPYDIQTIQHLDEVALVKSIGNLLFLHDEIFVMIDASGKPDEFGLREPTIDHLCQISAEAVRQATYTDMLGCMADNMYYELTRNIEQGYRVYTVYIDRLLGMRNINGALVFSDAFWRTLNYAIPVDQRYVFPYEDALVQSELTRERILRDEMVRRVELLRTRDQLQDALQLAERQTRQYRQEGIIPDEQGWRTADVTHLDLYLYVSLSLKWAVVTTQARSLDYEKQAERLLEGVIGLLEQPDVLHDDLLRLRRWYFLGQAYTARGYLRRLQQCFADAQRDAQAGWAAFKRYRERPPEGRSPEECLNDRVVGEVAQVMNNLAYSLARSGDMKRALRLSNELINEKGDYINAVSDYQKALFYNVNGLIYIRSARYLQAERPIERAEQAARNSQRQRARGLVAWARAQLETARMKAAQQVNPDVESYYKEAAECLGNEPDQLRELYYSWSSYKRDTAILYSQADDAAAAAHAQDQALELLDVAIGLLPEEPSVQQAEFIECKVTVCNVRGDYTQALRFVQDAETILANLAAHEYAQVLSGRIALQYADITLHHVQDYQRALWYMTIALARAYVFADQHHDQETFERLIDRFIEEIPDMELQSFQQRIAADDVTMSVDDLPYQRPDALVWATAWHKSVRVIDESITTQLNI